MEVRLKLRIAESEWDTKGKFNFNPTLMWVKGSILAEESEPLKKSLAAKTSETVPLIQKISFISCKQVNFGGLYWKLIVIPDINTLQRKHRKQADCSGPHEVFFPSFLYSVQSIRRYRFARKCMLNLSLLLIVLLPSLGYMHSELREAVTDWAPAGLVKLSNN